jgi:hypothetical protein
MLRFSYARRKIQKKSCRNLAALKALIKCVLTDVVERNF